MLEVALIILDQQDSSLSMLALAAGLTSQLGRAGFFHPTPAVRPR